MRKDQFIPIYTNFFEMQGLLLIINSEKIMQPLVWVPCVICDENVRYVVQHTTYERRYEDRLR